MFVISNAHSDYELSYFLNVVGEKYENHCIFSVFFFYIKNVLCIIKKKRIRKSKMYNKFKL